VNDDDSSAARDVQKGVRATVRMVCATRLAELIVGDVSISGAKIDRQFTDQQRDLGARHVLRET
jgi:hypothetical protein